MDTIPRRVTILSPHEVVVRGFTSMLGEHPGRAVVVDSAVAADLALYDVINLHEGNGSDLDRLLAEAPGTTVLAVARDLRPDLLSEALARGAHGFVPLDIATEPLLQAVETADHAEIESDGPWVPSDVDAAVHLRRGHAVGLTEREREVLGFIAQGHSNAEIAKLCFLSINSVKTYVRTGYRKIGASSRSQAVIWALTNGFASRSTDPDQPPAGGADVLLTRAV